MSIKFLMADGWVKVPVNTTVYPLQAIHSAGYVFMDRAHVRLDEDGKSQVAVWLKPKGKETLESLALSFSDELLNYAHYFSSLKANGDTMKLLLQRALFSASPVAVKESEDREIEDLIKELESEEEADRKKKKARRQ